MKEVVLKATINRSLHEVWQFVIDPKNTSKWVDTIEVEETNETPTKLGTVYRNRGADGVWTEYAMTTWDPEHHFVLTHSDGNFHLVYTLKPLGDKTCMLEYVERVDEGELENASTQAVIDKLKEVIEASEKTVELFDIVDHEDNVIGTTDKETAHATGQLHRVSAVFVFNQEGELYVQVHGRDGKWDHSVGGHVSKGESYAVAAVREAEEELGITQPLTELAISLQGDEYPEMQHMFGLYECIADPSWKFVPNDEVHEIFPMSLADIRRAMETEPEERFTRGFRITMAEYVRQHHLDD